MSAPLVSILCVTYNQREFVAETVAGMLAQDYPNLEAVIADDGSTDGTVELLRTLTAGDPRFTVVAGVHAGITANSNRALARCRGRYVAVMGGDDVMLPGKIARQVAWMEADEHRVLCGHDVEVFESSSGEALYLWSERFPLQRGRGAETAVQSVPFCATAIMVRRSAIPARGFDARVPVASDWKLWIDCLHPDGEYGYVEGVLARYRRHDRNVTGRRGAAQTEHAIAEQLLIWELVERDHPALARACRDARADACLEAAKAMHAYGERRRAMSLLWGAVRRRPLHTLRRALRYGTRGTG
jgi:glycosyltransferase involved in cell wall biosynthesis